MQYYVPQFIESESKIIGPLSLRQFFLIAGPAAFIFFLYFIFKSALVIVFGLIIIGGGAAFAFLKFQGQDLMAVFSYGISYFFNPKEYIWLKRGEEKITLKEIEKIVEQKEKAMPEKTAKESRLKQLSWILQTKPTKAEEEYGQTEKKENNPEEILENNKLYP